LEIVSEQDREHMEECLREAARAHLVQVEAAGYAFTHDKVREALYGEIGPTRRRRLHRAIGKALEGSAGAVVSPRRLSDLAFHFARAGDPSRGVTYALAAGERALRAYASAEAVGYFRSAIGLLERTGEDGRRGAALVGLGEAATLAADHVEAARSYAAARECA